MGLVKDDGAGHISIQYGGREAPFGGLDSSAPDAYITPNRLLQAANFALVDNGYVACRWTQIQDISWGGFSAANEQMIGFGEVSNIFFLVSYNTSTNLFNFYMWNVHTFGLASAPSVQPFPPPPVTGLAGGWSALTYYAINGVLYLSGAGLGCIYQVILPIFGNSVTPPTILTEQCGGMYLGELNGRLLAFNTIYQQPDTSYLAQPFQVAWSAGEEQYNVWNVLETVDSVQVPTGAGFNNIPDVEDIIAGFFTQGSTIYVIRTQGVSQISPLANGIEPFDFNHLWASPKGMGTRYPTTVSQYGSLGSFLSTIDIITMGYSGINTISSAAKSTIYSAANNETVYGALAPFCVSNDNDLYYMLTTKVGPVAGGIQFYTFLIDIKTQECMQLIINVPSTSLPDSICQNIASEMAFLGPTNAKDDLILGFQTFGALPLLYYVPATPQGFLDPNPFGSTLVFPPEEVNLLQEITVDGVGLYLNGAVGETLHVEVSGVEFQDVIITLTGWGYYRSMPNPTTDVMALTQMAPQLTLTYNGSENMVVGKATMYGSYTDARPF